MSLLLGHHLGSLPPDMHQCKSLSHVIYHNTLQILCLQYSAQSDKHPYMSKAFTWLQLINIAVQRFHAHAGHASLEGRALQACIMQMASRCSKQCCGLHAQHVAFCFGPAHVGCNGMIQSRGGLCHLRAGVPLESLLMLS